MEEKEKKSLEENSQENLENNSKKESEEKSVEQKKENIKKKESQKNKVEKKQTSSLTNQTQTLLEKSRENPWIVATIVLGVLVLVLLFLNFFGTNGDLITGKAVSPVVAGENLLGFVERQGIADETVLGEVESFNDYFYSINLMIEGQNLPVFVTKDGEYLIVDPIPLNLEFEEPSNETNNPQQDSSYSEEDLEKLRDFNTCLANEGIKIYGANWCGFTQQVVETLGGYEVMGEAYIECTENQELCSQENITGYPTIKFNGEQANIERTLQGFADVTGCSVPELGAAISSNPATASC